MGSILGSSKILYWSFRNYPTFFGRRAGEVLAHYSVYYVDIKKSLKQIWCLSAQRPRAAEIRRDERGRKRLVSHAGGCQGCLLLQTRIFETLRLSRSVSLSFHPLAPLYLLFSRIKKMKQYLNKTLLFAPARQSDIRWRPWLFKQAVNDTFLEPRYKSVSFVHLLFF